MLEFNQYTRQFSLKLMKNEITTKIRFARLVLICVSPNVMTNLYYTSTYYEIKCVVIVINVGYFFLITVYID